MQSKLPGNVGARPSLVEEWTGACVQPTAHPTTALPAATSLTACVHHELGAALVLDPLTAMYRDEDSVETPRAFSEEELLQIDEAAE
jgi:hypothetical protein